MDPQHTPTAKLVESRSRGKFSNLWTCLVNPHLVVVVVVFIYGWVGVRHEQRGVRERGGGEAPLTLPGTPPADTQQTNVLVRKGVF
jgi:hypothetical protein